MCRLFGMHAGAADVARDLLAPGRGRQPGDAEPSEPGRCGHRRVRSAPFADGQQAADRRLVGRRLRHHRARPARYDVRRARAIRQHRRAHDHQHAPVPAGPSVVRAQRCRRRTAQLDAHLADLGVAMPASPPFRSGSCRRSARRAAAGEAERQRPGDLDAAAIGVGQAVRRIVLARRQPVAEAARGSPAPLRAVRFSFTPTEAGRTERAPVPRTARAA